MCEICRQCRGDARPIPGWCDRVLISSCATARHSAARLSRPTVAAVMRSFLRWTSYSRTLVWPCPGHLDTVNLTSDCRLRELLARWDLDGVLIPGDALSYPGNGFFGSSRSRGPTSSFTVKQTKGPCIARSASSSSTPARSLTAMVSERTPWTPTTTWIYSGPNGLLTSSTRPGPAVLIVDLVVSGKRHGKPSLQRRTFFSTSLPHHAKKPCFAKTGEGPLGCI